MARTVSLPVAIAVRAILDGRIKATGLLRPVQPAVYNLILMEMDSLGVRFVEKVEPPQLWIRCETKPGEERVALVPRDAEKLIAAGYKVYVERSPQPPHSTCVRCVPDEEYAKVGCELVATNSWQHAAPLSAIIIGLKELPESTAPLLHRHVYFAHAYKNQAGWAELLNRFVRGGGMLWDLEFLSDDKGRRVAAFGRPAGIVGMALALLQWAEQQTKGSLNSRVPLKSWKSTAALIADVKEELQRAHAAVGRLPSVLVLGALGRCGGGAAWIARQCGVVSVTEWDMAETKAGGPFVEILQHDILVNSIYLSAKIPPFITREFIDAHPERKLSVVSDVSCDTSNPFNPLPIYKETTTLTKPVINVIAASGATPALDVIAIDHLPSLVPWDSSESFSNDLLPALVTLRQAHLDPIWLRAEQLFHEKVKQALAALGSSAHSNGSAAASH
jgi:alanine dehydrogenase